MSTLQALKDAFAGESQANRRYLAFARKAEADGFPHVAKLFRAIAEAETVHALRHLRVMGGVKSTAENLQAAAAGEDYEVKSMYPGMVKTAEAEGNKQAQSSFGDAMTVEKEHYGYYMDALAAVQAGKDIAASDIHVCSVCGHTVLGDAPDRCPVCGAKKEKFLSIR